MAKKHRSAEELPLLLEVPDESQLAGKLMGIDMVSTVESGCEVFTDEHKSKTPIVKLNDNRLLTVRAFNIVRNEKLDYLYLVQLEMAHEGEINVMKLERDKPELVSIQFKKHTEEYKGNFINFAVKWQEDEEPVLVLFFTCTRTK